MLSDTKLQDSSKLLMMYDYLDKCCGTLYEKLSNVVAPCRYPYRLIDPPSNKPDIILLM